MRQKIKIIFLLTMSAFFILGQNLKASEETAPPEMAAVIRQFLKGAYGNSLKDFQASTLALPERETIFKKRELSPERQKEISAEIKAIRIFPPFDYTLQGKKAAWPAGKSIPIGAKSLVSIDFRGPMMILLTKTADGLKVDLRYTIAGRKPLSEGSPEITAKKFLYFLFQKDLKALKPLLSEPSQAEALLKANQYPPGDLGQLVSLAMEMPVSMAQPGESYLMPSGEMKIAGATAEEALVTGLYGAAELPFVLKKIKGQWKVVPQPYIEMLQAMGMI